MASPSARLRFGYQAHELIALTVAISSDRFARYTLLAHGDIEMALLSYERNIELSEAMYGVLQGLEVALRNSLHSHIALGLGQLWFFNPSILQHPQTAMVSEVKAKIIKRGKAVTAGRMIAELSLGFWTALLDGRYEKVPWVPHLHKSFPHACHITTDVHGKIRRAPIERKKILARLNDIRDLRNRIAHHEPIINRNLRKDYLDIIEAISWVCPVTAAWVDTTNCLRTRLPI